MYYRLVITLVTRLGITVCLSLDFTFSYRLVMSKGHFNGYELVI